MKFSLQNRADQELCSQAREHQIERVMLTRNLGVKFSQNISWDFHNDVIVKKTPQKQAHIRQVMTAETTVSCSG